MIKAGQIIPILTGRNRFYWVVAMKSRVFWQPWLFLEPERVIELDRGRFADFLKTTCVFFEPTAVIDKVELSAGLRNPLQATVDTHQV